MLLLELILGRKFLTEDKFANFLVKLNFNGSIGTPENIIYCCLYSKVRAERVNVVDIILSIRQREAEKTGKKSIRLVEKKATNLWTLNATVNSLPDLGAGH